MYVGFTRIIFIMVCFKLIMNWIFFIFVCSHSYVHILSVEVTSSDLKNITASHETDGGRVLKKQISKGISDFRALTECSSFIDKTMLIKVFLEDRKNFGGDTFHLVTAPRKFGKSINLDMIRRFLAIPMNETNGHVIDKTKTKDYELFTNASLNLKIFQHKDIIDKHLMAHPVVYLDFSPINSIDHEEMVIQLKHQILELLNSYTWLKALQTYNEQSKFKKTKFLKGFKENELVVYMAHSLRILTEYLYEHFNEKKVIVLIDSYDKPMLQAIGKGESGEGIMNKISMVISQLIKGNKFVDRAFITGVSGALVHSESSDLKQPNLNHWHFLDDHDFAQFYGFTDTELTELLRNHQIDNEEAELIRDYYGGYKICNSEETIYNPVSIIMYLCRRNLRPYWFETGKLFNMNPFLNQSEFRKHIVELLLGDKESKLDIKEICSTKDLEELYEITNNLSTSIDNSHVKALFSHFFEQGYLSHSITEDGMYTIPNKEIEQQFGDLLEIFYSRQNEEDVNSVGNLLNIISEADNITDSMVIEFQKSLEKLFEVNYQTALNRQFHNEFDFHAQIFAAAKSYFGDLITGERPMPKIMTFGKKKIKVGRPDIVLLTKNNGLIIIEVKYRRSVTVALEQAKMYRPPRSMKPKFIKFMGINIYSNRTVEVAIEPRISNSSILMHWIPPPIKTGWWGKLRIKKNKTRRTFRKTNVQPSFPVYINHINVSSQNLSMNIKIDLAVKQAR